MTLTTEQKAACIRETAGGCCENLICPDCGHYGDFRIEVTVTAFTRVNYDGTSGVDGDHEWDSDSKIECPECGHDGTVKDFRIYDSDPVFEAINHAPVGTGQCPVCGHYGEDCIGANEALFIIGIGTEPLNIAEGCSGCGKPFRGGLYCDACTEAFKRAE